MPLGACPHCGEPYSRADADCLACGRPTSAAGEDGKHASGWWSIRLTASFWVAVSAILLLCGLIVVDPGEAKGRVVLIAVGAFGLLCSLPMVARRLIRRRRDRA